MHEHVEESSAEMSLEAEERAVRRETASKAVGRGRGGRGK